MSVTPKALKDLIDILESLPGVGPRSATRIAYYILKTPDKFSKSFSDILLRIKTEITKCKICFNYSESEICAICSDSARDKNTLLVVEDPLDVEAFEKTNKFKGIYHVLGGLISPLAGIGPEEIRIYELISRVKNSDITELVLATNPNLEGESTAIYIKNEINKLEKQVSLTRLARGLPTGADLDYADNVTLEKSLEGRINF